MIIIIDSDRLENSNIINWPQDEVGGLLTPEQFNEAEAVIVVYKEAGLFKHQKGDMCTMMANPYKLDQLKEHILL